MPTIEKTYLFVKKEGGGEDHVYEESGWVPTIVADELTPYTNYRAEGGAIVDGLQATAENRVSFQTLRRNNLTATFNAVRRQGLGTIDEGGWKVYYDYTSLYALSSAILYVFQNGVQVGQYQGVADYNNHWITFDIPASDWVCCGEQYDLHVVVIDIFGQSYTTPVTTITTDVFNSVSMEYASSTTSSVTFNLDYWLDSGFASGWLDVWNEGDDPDVDQPQDHYHFFEGDTQVTADGLDEGTTYIFRVTIALDDGQGTEIYTAYQYASTAEPDWSTVPFFIENIGNVTSVVTLTVSGTNAQPPALKYSLLGKDGNYTTATFSRNGSTYNWTTYLGPNQRCYLKGNNTNGFSKSDSLVEITVKDSVPNDAAYSVGGNIISLISENMSSSSVPAYSFKNLFRGDLEDVGRLTVGNSRGVSVGSYAFFETFRATGQYTFTSGMKLSNVTYIDDHGLENMYMGKRGLNEVYYPKYKYNPASKAANWLYNCLAGTIYAPTADVKAALEAAGYTVVPSGWRVVVQS